MKLSVIIPVYNEKNTVREIIEKVKVLDNFDKEIIVVDDCSTDGTKEVLKGITGIQVFFHERNQGKGLAIRTGLKAAVGEYVVIQDADLEYDPADFVNMVKKMEDENLKVLYGSRRLKKENTQYAGFIFFLGGVLLSKLTNILYGQRITDEPTCYKMFLRTFIQSMPLQGNRFEFCPEVTALTSKYGTQIKEVPISYFPRDKNSGKKINFVDGFEAIAVLLWYKFEFLKKIIPFSNMSKFFEWLRRNRLSVTLTTIACVNLIIFNFLYGFHVNNDTQSFIWTIERFRGINSPFHPNRYLNPWYPIVGATVFRFVSPAMSIILSNIFYYFCIVLLTYGLIRRVFRNDLIGFWSALALIPAYALLRYGLTQVQDIGGYFWFLLTLYAAGGGGKRTRTNGSI